MFTVQGAQMPIYQFRCKVTTKNAHTQVKQAIFSKKIDFIYLQYKSTAQREFTQNERVDLYCIRC